MKKIIRILFVCLFFIALIFIGKNVLKAVSYTHLRAHET